MLPSGGFLQSVLANYDPSRPPAAAVEPVGAVSPGSTSVPPSSSAGFGGFSGGAGGLGSSPNVPAPGSSIDPSTGLPHTAGLTRAELDARKASATGGAQSSGLMGGLGSSPNVPAPGTSINSSTGQPHVAGLSRAELDAIKAKGQALLDPVPSGVEIRRESAIRQNFAASPDLSGRDQAAAQLVGTGLAVPPSPTARKGSIVEDIEKNVRDLSQKAYNAVPAQVKDIFAEPKGKGVEGSPVKARRGSAAALFENVRAQATNLAYTVKEAVVYDPDAPKTAAAGAPVAGPPSGLKDAHVPPFTASSGLAEPTGSPTARRASVLDTVALQAKRLSQDVQTTLNSAAKQTTAEGGVLSQVKGFIHDAFTDPGDDGRGFTSPAQRYAFGTVPVGAVKTPPSASSATVPTAILPSQENQGARPGEVTGGVGALPGKLGEAGVAVPPEVRATEGTAGGLIATSSISAVSSHPTTSSTLGGLAGAGVGADAVAAAILGEPRQGDNVSGLKDHSVAPLTDKVPTTSSSTTGTGSGLVSSGLPDLHTSTATSNSSTPLAAPLPATSLGHGAAHGATDLDATRGVDASTASSIAPTTTSAVDSSSLLSAARSPNDRTASLASVTAIRHGHPGSRDHEGEASPLSTLPVVSGDDSGAGQKSTSEGTGPNHTTSLSPGDESQGVGHPGTKGLDGTSRAPGSYPAVAHKEEHAVAPSAAAGSTSSTTASSTIPKSDHSSETKDTPTSSTTAAATDKSTPTSTPSKPSSHPASALSPNGRKSLEGNGPDHKRTGSSSSTGKKVGFMQKLKGEAKILSGKLSHDEGKVTLGEKIKHGGIVGRMRMR